MPRTAFHSVPLFFCLGIRMDIQEKTVSCQKNCLCQMGLKCSTGCFSVSTTDRGLRKQTLLTVELWVICDVFRVVGVGKPGVKATDTAVWKETSASLARTACGWLSPSSVGSGPHARCVAHLSFNLHMQVRKACASPSPGEETEGAEMGSVLPKGTQPKLSFPFWSVWTLGLLR